MTKSLLRETILSDRAHLQACPKTAHVRRGLAPASLRGLEVEIPPDDPVALPPEGIFDPALVSDIAPGGDTLRTHHAVSLVRTEKYAGEDHDLALIVDARPSDPTVYTLDAAITDGLAARIDRHIDHAVDIAHTPDLVVLQDTGADLKRLDPVDAPVSTPATGEVAAVISDILDTESALIGRHVYGLAGDLRLRILTGNIGTAPTWPVVMHACITA